MNNKKSSTITRSKKKDSPKVEEVNPSTFPRKGTLRAQSLFENDFVPSESDSPQQTNTRFTFEREFETSEAESPVIKQAKNTRQNNVKRNFETEFSKDLRTSTTKINFKERKPRFQTPQKSLFEDDFSPTEKQETDDNGIPSIKEETNQNESLDSFSINNFDKISIRKSRLSKGRFSSGQLKKSESVNIFARESDPFDDEFFSGQDSSIFASERGKVSPKGGELKWTEEFDDFDIQEGK